MLKKILAVCALACCGMAIEAHAFEQDVPHICPVIEDDTLAAVNEENQGELALDAFVCHDAEECIGSENQLEPLVSTDLSSLEDEATLLVCEDCR